MLRPTSTNSPVKLMLHNQLKLLKLDQRIPPLSKHGKRASNTQKKFVLMAPVVDLLIVLVMVHLTTVVIAAVLRILQLKSSSELKIPTPHRFS